MTSAMPPPEPPPLLLLPPPNRPPNIVDNPNVPAAPPAAYIHGLVVFPDSKADGLKGGILYLGENKKPDGQV